MENNINFETLVLENIGLARWIAKNLYTKYFSNCDFEEIFQVAKLGLVKAAKTYNGSVKFATYATCCIKNEINYFFRQHNKHNINIKYSLYQRVKSEYNRENEELCFMDIIPSNVRDISRKVQERDLLEKVYSVICNVLPHNEAMMLLYNNANISQNEIAEIFGMTQSGVSKCITRSNSKIKKYVNENIKYHKRYSINIYVDFFKITFENENVFQINGILDKLKNSFKKIDISFIRDKVVITSKCVDIMNDLIINLLNLMNDKCTLLEEA